MFLMMLQNSRETLRGSRFAIKPDEWEGLGDVGTASGSHWADRKPSSLTLRWTWGRRTAVSTWLKHWNHAKDELILLERNTGRDCRPFYAAVPRQVVVATWSPPNVPWCDHSEDHLDDRFMMSSYSSDDVISFLHLLRKPAVSSEPRTSSEKIRWATENSTSSAIFSSKGIRSFCVKIHARSGRKVFR